MWTVTEAPPRQFRNRLRQPAEAAPAEAVSPAPAETSAALYDTWRHRFALIRAALAPFPLALAAVLTALEPGLNAQPAAGLSNSATTITGAAPASLETPVAEP